MTKLYPPQDPSALEPHYSRHVSAMTTERLDGKAEIAEQLAWRDKRIAELEAELEELKRPATAEETRAGLPRRQS